MVDVERLRNPIAPLSRIVSEKFQYDFGRNTRRNRRTVTAWLAISVVLAAAAVLFATR